MTSARRRAALLGTFFVASSVVLFADAAVLPGTVAIFAALLTGGWLLSDLTPATRGETFAEGMCPSCGHGDQIKRKTCPHLIEGGASGWGPEERCGCEGAFHHALAEVGRPA